MSRIAHKPSAEIKRIRNELKFNIKHKNVKEKLQNYLPISNQCVIIVSNGNLIRTGNDNNNSKKYDGKNGPINSVQHDLTENNIVQESKQHNLPADVSRTSIRNMATTVYDDLPVRIQQEILVWRTIAHTKVKKTCKIRPYIKN